MKILAFASQKGGSGKTTLAGHIAVEAERRGAGPVALVDADPQGSLTDWWNERQAAAPAFLQASVENLAHDVARARAAGVKLLVVDTPPAITDTIERVIALSDLVVVPTRPSPHDLRAAGATIELVEQQGKPLVFVVNAAKARARITAEAAVVLSQHGTVAPVTLHNRVEFAAAMIDGRTVMELSASKSAEEVGQLWDYIAARLEGARPTLMSQRFAGLGGKAPLAAGPLPAKEAVGA
jgi:chromosome partitioning protein